MSKDFLWVEKYRPKKIDDCILPASLSEVFKQIVDGGELPNMLFTGTAGLGKTTVAKALCNQLDLDWIINGDGNTINYALDIDGATSYLDIDGDSNNLTYDGDGAAGGYFYLDQTGNSRTFNIQQQSTLNNDWLKIITNSTGGTLCIIQDDQGTSTSC